MIVTFNNQITANTLPHSHHVHEFILGANGSGWLCTESGRQLICGQTSILVPAGVSHHYEIENGDKPPSVTYVCFDSSAFKDHVSTELCTRLNALLVEQISFASVDKETAAENRYLAKVLKETLRTATIFSEEKAGNTLSAILLNHLSAVATPTDHQQTDRKNAIADVMQWIEKNIAEDISIDIAAERAHMSRSVFTRNFKDYTGMSFTNFLNNTRLNLAATLLIHENFAIEEIANRSGYRNLGHFYSQFQNRYDMTPGEYRRVSKEMMTPEIKSSLRA